MKSKLSLLVVLFYAVFSGSILLAQQLPQLGKSSVKEVVKAMTLEEKAKLVVGLGMKFPGANTGGPTIGQTEDKVPGAAGTTFAIPRLGIPSLVLSDGPAGVRIDSVRKDKPGKTFYATAWPVGTLLASTWDTALVSKVGVAFGKEAKEYGVDIILAPALNIHRNPLGGRNFEYYSEDPLVSGMMAAAMVNGIESNGVGTSIKHFVANDQETNRNTVNVIASERALREIYLKAFEITVKKSQPWTVMSAYNYLNGPYTSENPELLKTVLRNDWGFQGFVMTDWFGGKDAVVQMKAGNDMLMPGTPNQTKAIVEAVQNGQLDEALLNENVERILNIVLLSPSFKGYAFSDQPDLKRNAQISREAASEGMILLKNDKQALPLQKQTIALFGINGYELIAGGTGSGDVNKAYKIPLVKGLSAAGFKVDSELQNAIETYMREEYAKRPKKNFFQEFMNPTPPLKEFELAKEMIDAKASSSGIAIVAIGRNAGEGRDRQIENDFALSDTEKALLKNVSEAFHAKGKKVVVVLNIGGVIEVASWRDMADAILLAWQPGLEGGNAIADVLSGKVNPSGKLATSFVVNYPDVPSAKNFPGKEFPEKSTTGMMGMKAIPAEVTYEEGIYVGYRYYNTFNVKPSYEFGYGLSYTTFEYSPVQLSSKTFNGKITVTVTVKNTGKAAGKEVVQVYLSAPKGKLDKPAEELRAFAKTGLLQPGKSQTLTFTLKAEDLASFDTESSSWVAEAGQYTVKVGASSLNIKSTADFSLPKDLVAGKVNKVLVPQVTITELKPAK